MSDKIEISTLQPEAHQESIEGLGRKTLLDIKEMLSDHGMSLKD